MFRYNIFFYEQNINIEIIQIVLSGHLNGVQAMCRTNIQQQKSDFVVIVLFFYKVLSIINVLNHSAFTANRQHWVNL